MIKACQQSLTPNIPSVPSEARVGQTSGYAAAPSARGIQANPRFGECLTLGCSVLIAKVLGGASCALAGLFGISTLIGTLLRLLWQGKK
jgi:hypothetical protein